MYEPICNTHTARKIIVLALSLLSMSCATNPNIHLYFEGDSEEKRALISQLERHKLNVRELNTPPSNIPNGNYIVYTPEEKSANWISLINSSLSSLGMKSAHLAPFKIGSGISSHQYTTGNIGLYILNPNNQNQPTLNTRISDDDHQVDVTSQTFGSKSCRNTKILEFYDDGKAILVDENIDRIILKGKWYLTNNQLHIGKRFSLQKFTIENKTAHLNNNSFSVINLIPNPKNNTLFNCVYSTYFNEGVYKH